MKPGHLTVLQ